jgi:hypothetical protein
VSDMYHEISKTGAVESGTSGRMGSGHDTGSYQHHDAEPEPVRVNESHAGADRYGETDLVSEYDGEVDAFIAGQDELPTPQESRAATWGDNPNYYHETDLVSEYDGDLSALTTDSQPALAGTEIVKTEPGRADEGQDTVDPSVGAQGNRPDHAELHAGDDGNVLSPEADQFRALETEHGAARQKIGDLEAERARREIAQDRGRGEPLDTRRMVADDVPGRPGEMPAEKAEPDHKPFSGPSA